ncbi:MAG: restriction endonuclease [Flavobacteriaceae bacterium]|nr:restriction endonuclease [Flavobacteriaceae bacterium]
MKINNDKSKSEILFFTNQKEIIKDECVFSLDDNHLTTYNIMGFIGLNDSELTIQSRFEKGDNNYFLHYMLAKVFSINLFNLKHKTDDENVFDFRVLLFPHFLKKAIKQGLYKEYKRKIYNDMNVKGSIDINLHIKKNVPFNGKVAYRVREYNFDNKVTQLIRHTIEFIKQHEFADILTQDDLVNETVKQIIYITPSYKYSERQAIINQNLRPINHPYFSEYADLQKICLQILRHQGLSYGCGKNKIYGLLFDGAWLWEEYLNTILKDLKDCSFTHPRNDIEKNPIYLFKGNKDKYKRYPDFYNERMVIDAKYKPLNDKKKIGPNDMNQIITYMCVLELKKGVFIYPFASDKMKIDKIGELKGYGGTILKYAFPIPQKISSFGKFWKSMEENEEQLKANLEQNFNLFSSSTTTSNN